MKILQIKSIACPAAQVAIKVVPQRSDPTESVREAMELAVMSTISHPNILGVQQFWCVLKHAVLLRACCCAQCCGGGGVEGDGLGVMWRPPAALFFFN